MPDDKKLPATLPTNSALPQSQSTRLVARGLLAVQQSLAVTDKEDAESLFKKGMRFRNNEGGTPQDDDKARTYLLSAAKLNHAEAQFELSVLLCWDYAELPEAAAWLEKSVSAGFEMLGATAADIHPPLHNVILHFTINLFGDSEVAMRIPSVLLGVGTVYMLYRLGEELWDPEV